MVYYILKANEISFPIGAPELCLGIGVLLMFAINNVYKISCTTSHSVLGNHRTFVCCNRCPSTLYWGRQYTPFAYHHTLGLFRRYSPSHHTFCHVHMPDMVGSWCTLRAPQPRGQTASGTSTSKQCTTWYVCIFEFWDVWSHIEPPQYCPHKLLLVREPGI